MPTIINCMNITIFFAKRGNKKITRKKRLQLLSAIYNGLHNQPKNSKIIRYDI